MWAVVGGRGRESVQAGDQVARSAPVAAAAVAAPHCPDALPQTAEYIWYQAKLGSHDALFAA